MRQWFAAQSIAELFCAVSAVASKISIPYRPVWQWAYFANELTYFTLQFDLAHQSSLSFNMFVDVYRRPCKFIIKTLCLLYMYVLEHLYNN